MTESCTCGCETCAQIRAANEALLSAMEELSVAASKVRAFVAGPSWRRAVEQAAAAYRQADLLRSGRQS